jgi:hypothetical protein
MSNGAVLRKRAAGGGFLKIGKVGKNSLTFGEIAAAYEKIGYTIEWQDTGRRAPLRAAKPRPVARNGRPTYLGYLV